MKEIKCTKCDYGWKTRSKMKYVSCPSCLSKVENKDQEMGSICEREE